MDPDHAPSSNAFGGALARAQVLFDRYGIGTPRTVDDLLVRITEVTGKQLTVVGRDETYGDFATALTYNFKDRSVIVLRHGDYPYYRARGLFHELGHIVFGHPGCQVLGAPTGSDGDASTGLVQADIHALYRKDPQELEAEALATILGRHLLRPHHDHDERVFG